jgi:hypothetical protein
MKENLIYNHPIIDEDNILKKETMWNKEKR